MIQLSYCTFGLTQLPFLAAVDAVNKVGYPGVEVSFHRDQFNPFELTSEDIAAVRRHFDGVAVKPACVATASYFFTPSRPHEPSLMCPDLAGRKRRIDLVRRGVEVARGLGVPLVTFGSGFIRAEHVSDPSVDPRALLVDSIHRCLQEVRDDEDMTLLLEPEPGMYIETLDQAIDLVNEIDSPHFKLHLDLCHIYCSEQDFASALAKAAPFARYLHISDAKAGCNLKMMRFSGPVPFDLDFAAYLVYFPDSADFLLLDRDHPIYFYDDQVSDSQKTCAEEMARATGITAAIVYVDYNDLYTGSTEFDDEVFTYLISVPAISFDVLDRARPLITYLRCTRDSSGRLLMDHRVANTLTGIVHYHEIPGEGSLDFAACFRVLKENGFSGYASVELYHHVALWQKALEDSFRHLSQFV